MLRWALIFFLISIVTGFFGFTRTSAASTGVARALFFIFLVVFLVFLTLSVLGGKLIF
ncbi:MAG: hypothetical protein USCAAHI_00330 [Beijerinckiaceae bacterium]|jgi:uncharacterized membrane protein YtjA (UPF0391 family)|nr:MAG: hypothetical protein USCAAHI_00330 [Beijerinckiaceae bacterium]